jgi:4-hydroxybenzoate polyprenyltransferase
VNKPKTDPDTAAQKSASLLTWLQLMRIPTVFTAISNILCGYLITHKLTTAELKQQTDLWLLLISSAGLYLGGMVLNDVFDTKLDAIERPERPIPSGRISRKAAGIFGVLLMTVGTACAAAVGQGSLLIALLIVAAVLLYDGYLKSTIAAPLGMGACRFLNLMLGASTAATFTSVWQTTPMTVAAGLGIYIVGVTVFAKNEAGKSSSTGLFAGVAIILAGIGLDAWLITTSGISDAIRGSQMALLILGLNILLRAATVVGNPQPARIQRTVGLMLLCIIFLDALMVFGLTGDVKHAVLIVMLVAPASLVRRFIPMS